MAIISDYQEDQDNAKPSASSATTLSFSASLDPSRPLEFLEKVFDFLGEESNFLERSTAAEEIAAAVREAKEKTRKRKKAKEQAKEKLPVEVEKKEEKEKEKEKEKGKEKEKVEEMEVDKTYEGKSGLRVIEIFEGKRKVVDFMLENKGREEEKEMSNGNA